MSAPVGGAPQVGPDEDPALAKLRGVGGWLSWFLLACFLGPVIMVGGTLAAWGSIPSQQMNALVSLAPIYGVARGFEITGTVVVGLAMVAVGIAIVQKRRFAALLAVIVLGTLVVFYAVDLAVGRWAAESLRDALVKQGGRPTTESDTEYVTELRSMLATLLWLWYFFRSKRVRVTFGPVTWRRAGAWIGRRLAAEQP